MNTRMILDSVQVTAYRSIANSSALRLGPITVLIGRNNSGKSALLRALYLLQQGEPFDPSADVRLRADSMAVEAAFGELRPRSLVPLIGLDVVQAPQLSLYARWDRTSG